MFPSNFVTSNLNDELESGKYELNSVHKHLNDKKNSVTVCSSHQEAQKQELDPLIHNACA